jgi:uncharacterized protein involved in tolerance to divalent cations
MQREKEYKLIIKLQASKKEAIEKFILEKHPYKVPEVIFITPESIGEKYKEWIGE